MARPDELLDSKQVAELLGITASSVERLRREGRGPRWTKVTGTVGFVGGRVRYRRSDVEAYLAERTVDPGHPTGVGDVRFHG